MEPKPIRCEPDCGDEASCVDQGDTAVCLCPDGNIMDVSGNCDNRRGNIIHPVLSTETSGVISSIELTSLNKSNTSSAFNSSSNSVLPSVPSVVSPIIIGLAVTSGVVFILITILVYTLRHKMMGGCSKRRSSGTHQTTTKPQPAIPQQHYASNPNYYAPNGHEESLFVVLCQLEIEREAVTFSHVIGEGCFGIVFKGEVREGDISMPVAVKVLKENASPETQNDFQREVEIMSTFSHENILRLVGVVMKDTGPMPWMVFEYMEHGDLAELLRKSNPYLRTESQNSCKLAKEDLLSIVTQVASGMLYLSLRHFVHRDLATRNCLVGNNLTVKISDFGMSRDIYTCDYYKIGGSRMLPVRWMAPESIMFGKFTLESDIWSYGVLLWEVYTFGKQPYYGHSNSEVVKLIQQGILLSPPDDCPPKIVSVMIGCWHTDPQNRISFQDVYKKLTDNSSNNQSKRRYSFKAEVDTEDYLIPTYQPN